MESSAPRLSIVIPAYNEARRITATLDATLAYFAESGIDTEVIVVDDGSTDATAEEVSRYVQTHPHVRLLRDAANRGKGYAVRRGMLDARGELRLFCDADGSTPIGEARKLMAYLEDGSAQVAIGSRELPGSDLARPQPQHRRMMGWVFRQLVRLIAVRGFRDTQCGFKAFRGDVARELFRRQTLDGFAFDVELLVIAHRLGYRVVEVPVRWLDSADSRVRPGRHSLEMLLGLFRIRLRALRGAYR